MCTCLCLACCLDSHQASASVSVAPYATKHTPWPLAAMRELRPLPRRLREGQEVAEYASVFGSLGGAQRIALGNLLGVRPRERVATAEGLGCGDGLSEESGGLIILWVSGEAGRQELRGGVLREKLMLLFSQWRVGPWC